MVSRLSASSDGSGRMLWVVFAAIVGSLLFTNFVVQQSSSAVSAHAEALIRTTSPTTAYLTSIRRAVMEAEVALSHYLHDAERRPELKARLQGALAQAEKETRHYLDIALSPAEHALSLDLQEAWLTFREAVARAGERVELGEGAPDRPVVHEVDLARRRLLEQVNRGVELNTARANRLVEEIRDARRRTVVLANTLTAFCCALVLVSAWLLRRESMTRRTLFEVHTRSLEARAEELEQFAGRVAHDIRNPLAAAKLAAELAMRKTTDGPARECMERVVRGLARADDITTALLDFARAGAKPDPGARADLPTLVTDVVTGLAPEAEKAGIELRVEEVPPLLAACSPGVYLSLLGNLVRNAMKYMGSSAVRRITVRVRALGECVRTEVEDTGPGIPPTALASLFQPYFRAQRGGPDGLGLGLATVKKLTESHGGKVGVDSAQGHGSHFWFELPTAGAAWSAATRDAARQPGASAAGSPGA